MIKKLMDKASDKAEKMSPEEKEVLMEILMELKKVASGLMADGMKEHPAMGMKKVSVMAKDQEGLEEGLEKAQELVEGSEGPEHEMAEEKSEMPESEDEEMMAEGSDADKLRAILAKKA